MNPYSVYGLTENPFPAKALEPVGSQAEVAQYAKRVSTAVRKEEIREIENKFFRVILAPKPKATSLWIQGEIGVGKTAILVYLCDLLSQKYTDLVKPVYIETPDSAISGIYDQTLKYLGRDFLSDLSASLVCKVLQSDPELVRDDKPEAVVKKLARSQKPKKELLNLLNGQRIDLDTVARVGTMNFGEGRLFIEDRFVNFILKFFSEEETFSERLREYPKSTRMNGLATLFYLVHLMGYKMTVVFMDQLEYVWTKITRHKRTALAIDLRELVQRSLPYASFLTTTNIDTTEDMRVNNPTIFRALPWDPQKFVEVAQLSPEKARELVIWYLNMARKKSRSFYPFTEEAIDSVYEQEGRAVGRLLVSLQGILDKATASKRPPRTIDEKFVEEHYGKAGPSPVSQPPEGIEIREEELGR
jgi:hypothetical protein